MTGEVDVVQGLQVHGQLKKMSDELKEAIIDASNELGMNVDSDNEERIDRITTASVNQMDNDPESPNLLKE